MKRILVTTFLIGALSVWSVAQRPQTNVEVRRPSTSVGVVRPQTQVPLMRPVTSAVADHPTTQVQVIHPQTAVSAVHPVTTVEVVHPQTTVEVLRPQTAPFTSVTKTNANAAGATGDSKKSPAIPSAQATTSMSGFKPKQAKDFMAAQKAASVGGGENKLGNETNVSEKDSANKASLLGKQDNQNMDVNPNIKTGNLAALGSAVEKKVEEKVKK